MEYIQFDFITYFIYLFLVQAKDVNFIEIMALYPYLLIYQLFAKVNYHYFLIFPQQ